VAELQITVRYFAIIRELLGKDIEQRSVPMGATVTALFTLLADDEPRLLSMRSATMLMVNEEYVSGDHELKDGDEVALIPPVSGGQHPGGVFGVTSEPLDSPRIEASVASPSAGALVNFVGTVRDTARGQRVVALEYEAYIPAAEKMLRRIGDEMTSQWSLEGVAILHRVGRLEPGEPSIVIAVASAHRDEAFTACRFAIERIKEIVPIWKKEFYVDGVTWVGSEAAYQREFGHRSVSMPAPME
jgi:molybdopterin synthase catalytic subunit